jgi:hypothetical protein
VHVYVCVHVMLHGHGLVNGNGRCTDMDTDMDTYLSKV